MEIGRIVSLLQRAEALAAANNYHSTDVVAFTPAVRALSAPLPPLDNLLAQALVEAGLPYRPLPRSLGLNFDVDTPTDLMVLAVHPGRWPGNRRGPEGAGVESGTLSAGPPNCS